MVFYGIDVGRGAVKAVSVSGQVSFPSYLAPYRERDLVSQADNVLEQLVVSIDGHQYFVGELARREGGTREFVKDKVSHDNTLPLLLTAIALLALDDYTAPKVVVGLPVSDYKYQARAFENKVLGNYRVQLPHKKVNIELVKGQVLAFPEGAGALWDMALSPSGKPLATALGEQSVGIIDVGWKTCNVVILRELKYNDMGSTTFPLGLSRAFNWFYKRISRDVDILPAEAELRLAKDGAPELQRLAREIRDQLAAWWHNWQDLDRIFLAGGGGLALAPYLDMPVHLVPDAQVANARGFYKVSRAQL